jgi:hypothetical protein
VADGEYTGYRLVDPDGKTEGEWRICARCHTATPAETAHCNHCHVKFTKLVGLTDPVFRTKPAEKIDHPAEKIDHPAYYGGKDNPYEAIKVIRAWGLNFALGSVLKYVSRHGKKDPSVEIEDLEKARWYLDNEITERKAAKAKESERANPDDRQENK